MTYARVIIPPDPIVTPADIAGSHASNDPKIAALISAATEEIDGPSGWVGRCFGPQTLEIASPGFGWYALALPCPPIISIVSVTYLDAASVRQTVAGSVYEAFDGSIRLLAGQAWPSARYCRDSVRVRYRAGYDGVAVTAGGTGPVPERARQAVIMAVQNLNALGAENLFLRSEQVEGIGAHTYTVSDQAGAIIRDTARRLLSGLKVPRI